LYRCNNRQKSESFLRDIPTPPKCLPDGGQIPNALWAEEEPAHRPFPQGRKTSELGLLKLNLERVAEEVKAGQTKKPKTSRAIQADELI
jgi:hypothetical protein